jgi:hypothetical protein
MRIETMRALGWLRDLFSSERGNVLVVGAAVLPLLIGSAAFAVDTIQLSVWKRQLQRAADSSAIAGAYALSFGNDTHDAIHRDLDKNKFPVLSQEEQIWVEPYGIYSRTVRVRLVATRTAPFMSIFTDHASTIQADARAALDTSGTFCMVSLYDGTSAGIDVNGNADVTLGCGMKSNCTGTDCVTAGGSSSITASPIAAVGGVKGDSNNFIAPTTLQPYSAVQADPFAYLPDPALSDAPRGCSGELSPATVWHSDQTTECFLSSSVKPSETLNIPAGKTVMIWGGDIDWKGDVNGTGVTMVMSGPGGAAGDLKINSQANLNLTSPGSGTYKGVLFYRDRRATNIEIKINGGASSNLTGALYFPSSDITFAGSAGMKVECLQMVGQILKFRGGANITNKCPTSSGASAFQQTVVRLVA